MQQAPLEPARQPLANLPAEWARDVTADVLELRGFGGESGDLDLEIAGANVVAVSDLLHRCLLRAEGGSVPRDVVWQLPVRARLHALLVVCLRAGWRDIALTMTCSSDGCDERVELNLALERLVAAARDAVGRRPREVAWGGASFRPVLPTGADLRRWNGRRPSDAELLARLGGPQLADGDVPAVLLELVEAALAEADPLVDVNVEARCPGCGLPLQAGVDVESAALLLLRRTQEELLEDVVSLAAAFGWSEGEILALPRSRRRRYRAMLAQATG